MKRIDEVVVALLKIIKKLTRKLIKKKDPRSVVLRES